MSRKEHFMGKEGEIKMDNKIHWYELCFYGDEDTESEKYVADKACSYVIKTEIKPVIDNKVSLKILFGEYFAMTVSFSI